MVVEGRLDLSVARKLLASASLHPAQEVQKRGRAKILAKLADYHRASATYPWMVLFDLDNDECPSGLLHRYGVPSTDKKFICRIAVKEIESWLLADAVNISKFLGVSKDVIPREPDYLNDAKTALISIAKQSRNRQIKQDLVPAARSLRREGRGYTFQLEAFVTKTWDVTTASLVSPSLARACSAVKALSYRI